MMNMREGILDALVDEGETIIQILEYLNFLKLNPDKEGVIHEIVSLLKEGKIYIKYPPELEDYTIINLSIIEDYWFELTQDGRSEWESIEA